MAKLTDDQARDQARHSAAQDKRMQDVLRYEEQRQRVFARFRDLGYGSQKKAAFETDTHPNIVNAVLAGRLISQTRLDALDEWSQKQAEEVEA